MNGPRDALIIGGGHNAAREILTDLRRRAV